MKKKSTQAIYFDSNGYGSKTYLKLFKAINTYNISRELLNKIIKLFDENIKSLEMVDESHYKLTYNDSIIELSDVELLYMLSSGTTKGVLLYAYVVASLQFGFDLIIDEIENHFHKTLVDNIISLYKDKSINKKNATIFFTTHHCLLLDLFNRQNNIWITKSETEIFIYNMYEPYNNRSELLKSKQFYNNTFNTNVSYNYLIALKKELKKI